MQEKLDRFEGHDVQASELRLLGSSHENVGQLEHGEEVLIIAKAVVSKIEHRDKSLGRGSESSFVRTHRAGITRFFVVPNDQGEQWLAEAKAFSDERFGVQSILNWTGEQGEDEVGGDDAESG